MFSMCAFWIASVAGVFSGVHLSPRVRKARYAVVNFSGAAESFFITSSDHHGCNSGTRWPATTAGSSASQARASSARSEEHTSELQSLAYLVCRLLLEKKKKKIT